MQGPPAITWRDGEELREMVGRLKREKEAVRRDLEEAGKENNRLAEELLEVSQESRALSKWGLENMKGPKKGKVSSP